MHSPRSIIPSRGRMSAGPIMFEVVRALNASDIFALATMGPTVKVAPPQLQKLRAAHHRAAQLVAAGKSDVEVALAVNRTPQRIRDLKLDPAFNELVALHRDQLEVNFAEETEAAKALAIEIHELTGEEIRERLEDPEKLKDVSLGELRQLWIATADRTVLPPKSSMPPAAVPTNITFNIAGRGLNPPSPNTQPSDDDESIEPLVIEHEAKDD